MKKFHLIIILLALLCGFAASCKTTKTTSSVRGKCETVALRSDRLSTSSATDSLMQHLALNADSLIIVFDATPVGRYAKDTRPNHPSLRKENIPSSNGKPVDDMYFLSSKPPADGQQPSAHADGAATAQSKPKALKVYGLHFGASTEKKSAQQSSLSDSNDKSMQSSYVKEDNKTKSSPGSAPKYVCYILIMAAAIYLIHRLRR